MDISILEDIGLTGAEIKVFMALLETGVSTAGPVVEKSGLQNAVVHRALHSLVEKGIITYILQGKVRQYQTVEPKLLLHFLDEKKKRLEDLVPELEQKKIRAKNKPKATLFQGVRGVKELINYMLETDTKEYFSYGAPRIAEEMLGRHFWSAFHNKRIRNEIHAKLLFNQSLKEWGEIVTKRKKTDVRLTTQEMEEFTETIICGNKIAIIIYLEKPYGILIEEEKAAKSYKKFFDVLWDMAK